VICCGRQHAGKRLEVNKVDLGGRIVNKAQSQQKQ